MARAGLRRATWIAIGLVATGGCADAGPDTGPGVPLALAQYRHRSIADLRYALAFDIPEQADRPIRGSMTATFTLREPAPVVFDFAAPAEAVHRVIVDGSEVALEVGNGHLVLPSNATTAGANSVRIDFTAGDGPLNRNPDFLYTLFVPDRARTAFPCFDQPDLKARYTLQLTVPAGWAAVANGPLVQVDSTGTSTTYRFDETAPLSTYLFAFAAGRFTAEEAVRDGRTMHLYHRETDRERVARNRDAIFDLHAQAIRWLEEYTGIPYPFAKFDFVAIPAFQYGGMEHAGAILYRAGSLFLDESPTQNQLLGRASMIAHETSHMWFGDLVTMRWFNDVWMKEVFANFMAAKIVNPAFPDIDHLLRFYLAHYPAAYGIDRTAGANPIRQDLENLQEAGTLYGAIIYQKAPIVMRQLERLLGDSTLRDGLREYLTAAPYGNADWNDLIDVLDRRTTEDLRQWSRVWVEQAGRPEVRVVLDLEPGGTIGRLTLRQEDPVGRGLIWDQALEVVLGYPDSLLALPVRLDAVRVDAGEAAGRAVPLFALPGGGGLGYAGFHLDPPSREYLSKHVADIGTPAVRAVAWMTLWEGVLDREIAPMPFASLALMAVPQEPDEQNVQLVLGLLEELYWRFLPDSARSALAPRLETMLWEELARAPGSSRKAVLFNAYVNVALSDTALARLERLWCRSLVIEGLPMSESRMTSLAEALAVRGVDGSEEILAEQLRRVDNADRHARFAFVIPALSRDVAVRDSVFESFRDPTNREHEPWVLSALSFINHPLRAPLAERHVREGLDLLEEIQRTGDIFFPLAWLNALLDGHASAGAADTIRQFLDEHPDYPPRLRAKVLQAADGLFRAAAIRKEPVHRLR
jgi:aminopeptidase N